MSEEIKEKDPLRETGIQRLVAHLLRKSWIVLLVSILTAAITFFATFYLITPQYESATLFYVNNNTLSLGDVGLSSGDLTTRKNLVDSYIVILESREYLLVVADYASVDRSYRELQDMITASSVNDTEIFQVVVTSPDAAEAQRIANAIVQTLPKRIEAIIEGASAKVVDSPIVATSPSFPSYTGNTVLGFLAGFMLSASCIVLYELFDVTIRSEEDVLQSCTQPVLAAVPDMMAQPKGGYYCREQKKRHGAGIAGDKETALVGGGISFAASEAYKLLRTKLQFSFADDGGCHIIGVSSALAGEGKSISSVNLAHSLAQLEKRVLLIDCDMRRPSLSAKLSIRKAPGLSNYLTRQVHMDDVIQKYATGECAFYVISSGRNPPNPIELLSSARMRNALDQLRESYDYIILDLPPVGEVSDALVAAKLVDGILLVVRQNYCNRPELNDAIRQFCFAKTRILGIVLNCATGSGSRYGKRYKSYKRDYRGSVAAGKAAQHSNDRSGRQ